MGSYHEKTHHFGSISTFFQPPFLANLRYLVENSSDQTAGWSPDLCGDQPGNYSRKCPQLMLGLYCLVGPPGPQVFFLGGSTASDIGFLSWRMWWKWLGYPLEIEHGRY